MKRNENNKPRQIEFAFELSVYRIGIERLRDITISIQIDDRKQNCSIDSVFYLYSSECAFVSEFTVWLNSNDGSIDRSIRKQKCFIENQS